MRKLTIAALLAAFAASANAGVSNDSIKLCGVVAETAGLVIDSRDQGYTYAQSVSITTSIYSGKPREIALMLTDIAYQHPETGKAAFMRNANVSCLKAMSDGK